MKAFIEKCGNMYHFLSRLYMFEVDGDFYETLKGLKFPGESQVLGDRDMAEGYELMETWLKAHAGTADDLDDLAVDYARVFLSAGVASGKAAFPYESVYANRKHLMMQECASDMMALYAKAGLEIRKDMFHVPADHVALEFEYMAWLCDQWGETKALDELSDFFKNHLQNWVPVFAGEVMKYAQTDFYKGIGMLTRGFMNVAGQIFKG